MVRPRFDLSPVRLLAAVPFACVAVSFVLAAVAFRSSGQRVTDAMMSMAKWPAYELLASSLGILLPLATSVGAAARYLAPAGPRGRVARAGIVALVASPFFVVAWWITVPVFGEPWFFLGFCAFAVVHLISFECAETRLAGARSSQPGLAEPGLAEPGLAEPGLAERLGALRRSAFGFARCYGLAMLAAMLAVVVWIIPMDANGEIIANADDRFVFLSVAIGSIYFALHAVSELLDVDGLLVRLRERQDEREARRRDWLRQNPVAAPGPSSFGSRASAGPLSALDLEGGTSDQIQVWGDDVVRFGRSRDRRRRERRLYAGIAAVAFVVACAALWVGTDPDMFERKHARGRDRPHRHLRLTHSGEVPSAARDRAAFRAIAGFFAMFVLGFGIAAWRLRGDRLGRALAFVDRSHGTVRGRSGEPTRIAKCALVVRPPAASDDAPQTAHAARACAASAHWSLVVRPARTPGVASDDSAREIPLLRGVSLRDAELVAAELLPFGFTELSRAGDSRPAWPAIRD